MEKGHLIIGSESEQRTTLHDVGLGGLWDRSKPAADTVGAVALEQTENQAKRLKLVGFKMKDTRTPPKDGSIVVDNKIRGHVCIARYSYTLQEAIGMALVVRPKLLLLDEPLLGLSPMMQQVVMEAVVRLKENSGITVLLSEQFARPVLPVIDRGYVVENGMLALYGTGAELMDNPEIKSAYFGI